MRYLAATILGLLVSMQTSAESLTFAIYHVTGDQRVLLAQDRLDYTASDIQVMEWGHEAGFTEWKKSLKLAEGFSIGALVMRTEPSGGFGLWINDENHPEGFSWEWFHQDSGNIFSRLQGQGLVRVGFAKLDVGVEIQSIEFLKDVTLYFNDHVKTGPGEVTHEVVISQGSVLRFP